MWSLCRLLQTQITTIYWDIGTEPRHRRKAWGWALESKLAVSFKAEGHADRATCLGGVPESKFPGRRAGAVILPLTDPACETHRRTH